MSTLRSRSPDLPSSKAEESEARLASARHFVFLLIPNFSMIAFVNALEVLRMTNQVSGQDIFKWSVLSPDGLPVMASNGLTVDTAPVDRIGRADILFVCAGNEVQRATTADHLKLVRHFARGGTFLGGICTGAYVLAKAGVLTGYTCAIHWEYLFAQTEAFTEVAFQKCIFKVDRDRITCAGGIAPLEMMLYIVRLTVGAEVVAMISDQFSVESIRTSDARQKTARYGSSRKLLSDILELMESNIETPLSLVALSERSGVCERQLLRLFKVAFEQSVMQHYRSLRLRRARQLLLQSSISLTEIWVVCGFQSHSHFTTSYRREFGLTPGQERTLSEREPFGSDPRNYHVTGHVVSVSAAP
ncbi:GlxA family transcriptional regulator [Paraburkholderia sp.]|uniref:GlxA family transcriptional regulator n=1 Tax=Paraburkholderia sp. TaxID=1926495 RepID=UPI003D6F6DC5